MHEIDFQFFYRANCGTFGIFGFMVFFSQFLQFYSEIGEAESWMREKQPLLTSSDLGKDEDSVQVSLYPHLKNISCLPAWNEIFLLYFLSS